MSIPSIKDLATALANAEPVLAEGYTHFSQSGEDVVVNLLLANESQKGMFVDIGAYHPYRFSNTFLLYLKGWRGVNIDASETSIEAFQAVRPQDISVKALVSDKVETLAFHRYAEGAYNTANPASIAGLSNDSAPTKQLIGVDNVVTTTPNQIFEQYVAGKKFDFLNMDVEGLDERLFLSIDFNRFRPKVIAIEIDLVRWNTEPFASLLKNIGYSLHSQCFHTSILVNNR